MPPARAHTMPIIPTSKKQLKKIQDTIEVVDKSGKVISSSRSILSAFKDAQKAYKIRKAEVMAERRQKLREKEAEKLEKEALRLARIEKDERRRLRREKRERREKEKQERLARGDRLEDIERDEEERRRKKEEKRMRKREREEMGIYANSEYAESIMSIDSIDTISTSYSHDDDIFDDEHTGGNNTVARYPGPNSRAIDFDLDADTPLTRMLTQLTFMLENMSCMHQSMSVLIQALQKDPDSLAVVGLTLAEIAAVVTKTGPTVIAAAKTAYPVIFGLLASPHFLVMAGAAGIGTVIVLGGYKIYKKVMGAGPAVPPPVPADEYYPQQSRGMYEENVRRMAELELDDRRPRLLTQSKSFAPSTVRDEDDMRLVLRERKKSEGGHSSRSVRSRSMESKSRRHRSGSLESKSRRKHRDQGVDVKEKERQKDRERKEREKRLQREREERADREWEAEQEAARRAHAVSGDPSPVTGAKEAIRRFFTEK